MGPAGDMVARAGAPAHRRGGPPDDAGAGIGPQGVPRPEPERDVRGEPTIEAATAHDAAEIGELHVASRAAALPFPREVHRPGEMRAWLRDVVLPRGTTWVVRWGDRLCGFMTLDGADIDQLCLHPDMRRRGLGAALVEHAKAMSPRGLRLVTLQGNASARAFYEAHGFAPVAYGDGSRNEEGEPDVFCEWMPSRKRRRAPRARGPASTPSGARPGGTARHGRPDAWRPPRRGRRGGRVCRSGRRGRVTPSYSASRSVWRTAR